MKKLIFYVAMLMVTVSFAQSLSTPSSSESAPRTNDPLHYLRAEVMQTWVDSEKTWVKDGYKLPAEITSFRIQGLIQSTKSAEDLVGMQAMFSAANNLAGKMSPLSPFDFINNVMNKVQGGMSWNKAISEAQPVTSGKIFERNVPSNTPIRPASPEARFQQTKARRK